MNELFGFKKEIYIYIYMCVYIYIYIYQLNNLFDNDKARFNLIN